MCVCLLLQDRGEKRNVLIVSLLLHTDGDLAQMRSNTQRRVYVLRVCE